MQPHPHVLLELSCNKNRYSLSTPQELEISRRLLPALPTLTPFPPFPASPFQAPACVPHSISRKRFALTESLTENKGYKIKIIT
jgi:hypothetical protein